MDKSMLQTVLPVAVLLIVVVLRIRKARGMWRLNPASLWIRPLILIGIGAAVLFAHPPTLTGGLAAASAFVVGGLLGWKRGQMIEITRNEEGQLMQKATPAAMILLVVILVARFALRAWMGGDPTQPLTGNALVVTDAMLMFMVGLVSATALEIGIRAKLIMRGDEQPA